VEGVTFDVVVCDNNSSDDTKRVVDQHAEQWATRHGDRFPLRYLFEPTQGKSHALNRIVTETSGDWLLLIDDDIKVDSGWLRGYIEGDRKSVV